MENLLQNWERIHFQKIANELNSAGIKISPDNIGSIIEHTSFEKRSKRDKSECPYYELEKPCHDIEDLNCLLCACPNYESDTLKGGCRINSSYGKITEHENLPEGQVWDCSNCSIGHDKDFVKSWLEQNINYLSLLNTKNTS
jgi:Zn-finger protein